MLLASDFWGTAFLVACYPHGLIDGGDFTSALRWPACPVALQQPLLPFPQRMEQMLGAFQSDLSSISSEIRTLQEQSGAMNIRLRNRQAVRGKLGELVDGLVVPSALVT